MAGPKAGERISEYVLDEPVGAGSFGQVWKAHHHIWKSDVVAIKIPTDSQFVRNLQREGTAIHGLRHTNIVRAIGLDPFADTPYLVMEYIDGASLQQIIADAPKGLPIQTVTTIAFGILRALEHSHANGVIHRDIKPANILIAGGGRKGVESITTDDVKVTDFGLGHAGETTAQSILQSGSMLAEQGKSISGTIAYMAPEQRDGGTTDARSDLYSVGIVLFEMICGGRPVGIDMPWHLREGLPSWVDLVFSRLYTRWEHRFANAAEVMRTIEMASEPPVTGATTYQKTQPARPIGSARKGHSEMCAACGARVEAGDNFCIMCGEKVVNSPRRCVSCGAFPSVEDKFCIFCGGLLPEPVGG
jgi:serine/threonine-protein kinase